MTDTITLRFEATPDMMRVAMIREFEDKRLSVFGIPVAELIGTLVIIAVLIGVTVLAKEMGRTALMVYAGFLVGLLVSIVFFFIFYYRRVQRAIGRYSARMAEHFGQIELTFDGTGMVQKSNLAEYRVPWSSVDRIEPFAGGTRIDFGAAQTNVEDAHLPDDMTGEAFRARLQALRAAA